MTERVVVDLDSDMDGWQPELPALPRPTAVNNLSDALRSKGLSPGAVRTLARAAVRPDEMRRKLADPLELRVQGGTLLIVETRLWTMAVWPHPANPREYGHRLYPLSDHPSARTPLVFEPTSQHDGGPELQIRAASPGALEERITEAKERLIRENPLFSDIAAEGVLQPLTVVSANIVHSDGAPPMTLLIAADGSSRISSAHRVVAGGKLEKHPSSYALAYDDRKFRKWISPHLRQAQRLSWNELDSGDRDILRALTLPARVIVGFRPDKRSGIPFHTAVRNLIGLTHIRPPKPYGASVENEAKADAVLDALSTPLLTRPALINKIQHQWYGGTITKEKVHEARLPEHPDLRAAEIVRSILGGGRTTTLRVNSGIRALTAKLNPRREERVDIAVELILRPLRTDEAANIKIVKSWRATLQRAYLIPEISEIPGDKLLETTGEDSITLEALRDLAIEEVEQGHGHSGHLAQAQIELAIKAAYYMATSEPMALQREIYGGGDDDDDRSLTVVLRAMLSRTRGVIQAYNVIKWGREGKPLLQTNETGKVILENGKEQFLTDKFIRETYSGQHVDIAATGIVAARQQWDRLVISVKETQKATKKLGEIPASDGGPAHVSRDGWDSKEVLVVRKLLDKVDRTLGDWGDTFDLANHLDSPEEQ